MLDWFASFLYPNGLDWTGGCFTTADIMEYDQIFLSTLTSTFYFAIRAFASVVVTLVRSMQVRL